MSHSPNLSDLPPEIVDGMLSRLPIRDAVRTSILSRWWRHRWQSIPDLLFDGGAASYYRQICAVDHVLLLHRRPIRSFSLNHPSSHHHASRWLAALAVDSAPLRSLSLLFSDVAGSFPVCSTLFSFRNLTHLSLRGCALSRPSHSLGFPNLQTLSLEECASYDDYGSLSVFVSNCPLLQKLILRDNQCRGRFHVGGPNLRSLDFCGWFEEFVLIDAPLLTTVSILLSSLDESSDDDENGDDDENDNVDEGDKHAGKKWDLTEMFRRVRCIEKLELVYFTVSFLGLFRIPKSIDHIFERLKVLALDANFDDVKEALTVLCLLRSSPNLQDLEVGGPLKRESVGLGHEFWQQQDPLELPKLHTLKITCFHYAPADLEFLCFVLPKAQKLRKLAIGVALDEDGSFDQHKFEGLKLHLEAFTRAKIS